jgi:hypothetical protein
MLKYADTRAALANTHPTLATALADVRTLEHLLAWFPVHGIALAQLEMWTADEYCHDLLVPWHAEWLVFGMT